MGRENKRLVSIRYSPRVIDYFKSTGKGWQSRMDAVLAAFVDRQERRSRSRAFAIAHAGPSGPVVRMAGPDRRRTVELFGKHGAGEAMRPGPLARPRGRGGRRQHG